MVRVASPIFVGRAAELAALDEALEMASTGRTTTILIGADAGVGKSRLLSVWNVRARERGAKVISGGCLDAGESGPAYAAIVQALRDLLVSVDPAVAEAYVGVDRTALGRILPGLAPSVGPIEADHAPMPAAQTLVFQRFVDVLARAAGDGPTVVELEDLHWADPSTRAFLTFLVMSLPTARLLVVGTFRTEELVPDHPLASTLRQLSRNERVARIELKPFDLDEVRELSTAVVGREPSDRSVKAIFARSEGNALFVEELLEVGDPEIDLPTTIGEAMLARISRLSAEARSILRLASVAGRTTSYEVLLRASSLDEPRLTDALRSAVTANILEPEHAGERYRFRHALLREAVYGDTMPGERRRLHGAVAAALESTTSEPLSDPILAPRLAGHWYEAGDHARALTASVAAADLAARQSAHAEAVLHYDLALEIWDRVPESRRRHSRAAVLERAARSAYLAGQPRKAVDLGERALLELDITTDPIVLVALLDVLRLASDHVGDDEALLRYATRLADIDPTGLPLVEQARILDGKVMVLQREGDLSGAAAAAKEVQQLVDHVGDPGSQARAHLTMGWVLLDAGDFDGVVREARAAADLGSLAADNGIQVQAQNLIYEAAWSADRYEETIAAARAFRAFADRMGLLRWEGSWAALAEAESLYALGRLGESRAVIEEQLRDPPADRSLALLRLLDTQVAIALGALPEAAVEVQRAADAAMEVDDEITIGYLPLVRAQLANAEGRLDDVRSIVIAAGTRLAASGPNTNAADQIWSIVEVGLDAEASRTEAAHAAGDSAAGAEAQAVAATMVGYVDDLRIRRVGAGRSASERHRGAEALMSGHLARIAGRDDPALWMAAAEAFPASSVQSLVARYRQAEAMLAARSERKGLTDLVSSAHAQAVTMRATPLATRLESLARRARIDLRRTHEPDLPSVATSSPELAVDPGQEALRKRGLSPREIEVLTLVASGYSNGQIAARLFISTKTASVHVSHILDKLGASSRTEAATIGVRLGLPEVEAADG